MSVSHTFSPSEGIREAFAQVLLYRMRFKSEIRRSFGVLEVPFDILAIQLAEQGSRLQQEA